MEKKYFANLEYREVNGVFIPDIELPEEKEIGRFGWQHEKWLKTEGTRLMRRMTG